jgi:hypothetical protein
MRSEPEDESSSDEIRREDGVERYWFFYNGEWAETVLGLAAVMGGVFWCFLYILGYSQTYLGYALGGIAILGFFGWRIVMQRIRGYEEKGWPKEERNTAADERKKLFVALGLWTFIILFFGGMMLSQYRHR